MVNPHAGSDDPHADQPVATAGADLSAATAAVVLVHGRGATAEGMIDMAADLERDGVAFLAPQAAARTWYPNSFLEPVEQNEPGRTSGLGVLSALVDRTAERGVPADRVMFVGFSQGACLASEFVVRNPRRYGGLAALSGGLIGESLDDEYAGDLDGTPAFVGCSDVDPHIPVDRVHDTTAVLEALGADVEERIYEGMGHGINTDEIEYVGDMVDALVE